MVDAGGLNPPDRKVVRVRVPPRVLRALVASGERHRGGPCASWSTVVFCGVSLRTISQVRTTQTVSESIVDSEMERSVRRPCRFDDRVGSAKS